MKMYGFNFTFVALVFLDRSQSAHLMTEASAVKNITAKRLRFPVKCKRLLFAEIR